MHPITASPHAGRFLALLKPDCKVPTANFADSALNATPVTAATKPNYQYFDNTLRQNKQNYKAFGTGQMVIFG